MNTLDSSLSLNTLNAGRHRLVLDAIGAVLNGTTMNGAIPANEDSESIVPLRSDRKHGSNSVLSDHELAHYRERLTSGYYLKPKVHDCIAECLADVLLPPESSDAMAAF